MDGLLAKLDEAAARITDRVGKLPPWAVVLGSGLGGLAERLEQPCRLPFGDIPHFASSTVQGHDGALVVGRLPQTDVRVAVLAGRLHAYEGLALHQVVFPVRSLARAGCQKFLLTNAAGGLDPTWTLPSLMLIEDHLNLMGSSPLTGPNDTELGPRFPSMSRAYDPAINDLIRAKAEALGIPLRSGTYAATPGPQYETPAEARMIKNLGADAVGMSTVPEVIALNHLGARVAGISCITNHVAGGDLAAELDHGEVIQAGQLAAEAFQALVLAVISGDPT